MSTIDNNLLIHILYVIIFYLNAYCVLGITIKKKNFVVLNYPKVFSVECLQMF